MKKHVHKPKAGTLKNFVYQNLIAILEKHPDGLRANILATKIHKESNNKRAGYKKDAIFAMLPILANDYPDEIHKNKEKGIGTIYHYKDPKQADAEQTFEPKAAATSLTKRKESVFYESFATYLEYGEDPPGLDECTKALAWGGNKSGGTWVTPDVVGVLCPEPGALINFSHEIVSAEIKIDPSPGSIFTAFGQACAYRLFSHKVYMVVPKPQDDVVNNRINSLCLFFGLGLVYFNPDVKFINSSIYNLQLPALRRSPDTSYVSNFVSEDLERELYGITPKRKKL